MIRYLLITYISFFFHISIAFSSQCTLVKMDGTIVRNEKMGLLIIVNQGTKSEKSYTVERKLQPKLTPYIDHRFGGLFEVRSFLDGTRDHIYDIQKIDYFKVNPLKDATMKHIENIKVMKCPE